MKSADAKNAVIGVWSTTERRRLEVKNADFDSGSPEARGNDFVQVSRLGNPLVNEVVIPLGKKDQFNRTTPDRDAALYGKYVVKPELAAILNALFNIGAPTDNRTDIVQALLQGIPGLNQHKGIKGPPAVDTLKLNLGTPPASGAENRFGVIGGDNAGFPNGRRLGDDVVDIELQVVAGFLKGNKVPLGDGVDVNDKPFLSSFPYLAAPGLGLRLEALHPDRAGARAGPGRGVLAEPNTPEGAPPCAPSGRCRRTTDPMALRPPTLLLKLAVPAVVFAALLAILTLVNRSDTGSLPSAADRTDVRRAQRRHARTDREPAARGGRPARPRAGIRGAGRRLSPAHARDRRPVPVRARGAVIRRGPSSRPPQRDGHDRRRHARPGATRLRRGAAPGRARASARARDRRAPTP